MFVVLDLETTGLSPKNDLILECALIIVDEQLNEIRRWSRLVRPECAPVMSPYVCSMHTKNLLLADLSCEHVSTCRDLDRDLGRQFHVHTPRTIVLVGNSIHFDRGFLFEQCPAFYTLLSHQQVDVSSFNVCEKVWGSHTKGASEHRAMGDCESSLAQLRAYKARFWGSK